MMDVIKKWWKFSSLRFYILNTIWNYGFWLNAIKQYKIVSYFTHDSIRRATQKITKKRFVGYFYKGEIYLDNPGLKIKDRDVWKHWKNKKLIK